jgi:hypothetical protein
VSDGGDKGCGRDQSNAGNGLQSLEDRIPRRESLQLIFAALNPIVEIADLREKLSQHSTETIGESGRRRVQHGSGFIPYATDADRQ